MSIELTEQQQQALAAQAEEPPRVVNPRTNETYVLLRAEVYERLRSLLRDDMPDVAPLINEAMEADDANDPLLESYQHYRKDAP